MDLISSNKIIEYLKDKNNLIIRFYICLFHVVRCTAKTIILSLLFISCESNDRFYRPDLPEKLCVIGIIDVDDTTNYNFSLRDIIDTRNSTRYLTVEKSIQSEYCQTELYDSLSDLSFKIYSEIDEIFSFHNTGTIINPLKFELPDSLIFYTGNDYYFQAKEKDLPQITAKTTVPEIPSDLILKSIREEVTPIESTGLYRDGTNIKYIKTVVFDISFANNYDKDHYYMILLIVRGLYDITPYSGPHDFSVRETNTPGFFAEMQGINTYHWVLTEEGETDGPVSNAIAYFINENKIPENYCNMTLAVQYNDGYSPIEKLASVQIKLLSIPEVFYHFEKDLYNYGKIKQDPFSEPVYLNGNIKNGNGVFAVCRSSELIIKFPLGFKDISPQQ
ncbi:MAG: DUF4249 family protein [Bacteroidota bacterium]